LQHNQGYVIGRWGASGKFMHRSQQLLHYLIRRAMLVALDNLLQAAHAKEFTDRVLSIDDPVGVQ